MEVHEVVTEDGYVLGNYSIGMHRVDGRRKRVRLIKDVAL